MKLGALSEVPSTHRGQPARLAQLAQSGPDVRSVSAEEGYRLWAATYDIDPNPLLALEERTLSGLLGDVRGRDVVDLACGTGRWLATTLALGARSGTAVDLSAAMLRVAQNKAGLGGRLVRGDCRALPLASGIADLMICSFALGHIAELGEVAAELARVARPRAELYVTDLDPQAYARGWRTGFRSNGEPVAVTSFAHSAEKIRRAFEASGFELASRVNAFLDEPERPIFERAGKADLFDSARETPAVLVCRFQRLL